MLNRRLWKKMENKSAVRTIIPEDVTRAYCYCMNSAEGSSALKQKQKYTYMKIYIQYMGRVDVFMKWMFTDFY